VYKDPNSRSALALRAAFPTPAALNAASVSALQTARCGTYPSTAKLLELQHLAASSIGTRDAARMRGLTFEQSQLIAEVALLEQHVEALDTEIAQLITHSREGRILTSIPGIGPMAAATIIALIGTIANFDRPAQLKAYCGWAPTLTQSGRTLDHAKLTPRGVRVLKQTIYLAVWQAVRTADNEFAALYERLVPRKCAFDERKHQYIGRNKVVGRVAGQLITVIFTLLKRDQEATATGGSLPEPELYDPAVHRRHRAGQYQPRATATLGNIVHLPVQ
jgi:hypothetical protein